MEQIIESLKQKARDSWSGEVGEQRAMNLEKYLRAKLEEYSNALGISQEELLNAWERDRDYSAINYYQECNQPAIKSDKVRIFETVEDMLKSIGDGKFRCPACGGISTNPYKCNSGLKMSKGKVCDWNVGGLFGDLGKGIFVYCKDKLRGETIFMPISWENN
jgi:hypothetical protein